MEYTSSECYGFSALEFVFEGKKAILVRPDKAIEGNKWLLKTEYFSAFPKFEIEMLKRGYHLAFIENDSRWVGDEDIPRKARFANFLTEEFGLHEKCVPVGMSCGGMIGVYFASDYPEKVAVLYIDAPVMNLLSCPLGNITHSDILSSEFFLHKKTTYSEMLNFRDHPIDRTQKLLDNNIPVFLVCGDSDTVVPYSENGGYFAKLYSKGGGIIETVVKPGCDHHPHGLEDNTALIAFVEKYYL